MVNPVTMSYFTAGPVQDGPNAVKNGRSSPDPYRDTPFDYVSVPVGKGCVLILTASEYRTGLKRGKTWRRQVARAS